MGPGALGRLPEQVTSGAEGQKELPRWGRVERQALTTQRTVCAEALSRKELGGSLPK